MTVSATHQNLVNILHKQGKVAYVVFDMFGRSINVYDHGPGTWITTTLKYAPDGSVTKY